jgi:hypothetical protein
MFANIERGNISSPQKTAKQLQVYNLLLPIFKEIYGTNNYLEVGFLVMKDTFHKKIASVVATSDKYANGITFKLKDDYSFVDGYLVNPYIPELYPKRSKPLEGYYLYIDAFLQTLNIKGLSSHKSFGGKYEGIRNIILSHVQTHVQGKNDNSLSHIVIFIQEMQKYDRKIRDLLEDVSKLEYMLFRQQDLEKTLASIQIVPKMINNIRKHGSLAEILTLHEKEYNEINVSFIVQTLYKLRDEKYFNDKESNNMMFEEMGEDVFSQFQGILLTIDQKEYSVTTKTKKGEKKKPNKTDIKKLRDKQIEVFKKLDYIFNFISNPTNEAASVEYLEKVLNVDTSKIEKLKEEIESYKLAYKEKKERYVNQKPLSVNNLKDEKFRKLIKEYQEIYNKDIVNIFNYYFLGIYDISEHDIYFNDILLFYLLLKKELVHDVTSFVLDNNSDVSMLNYDSNAASDNSLNDNVSLESVRTSIIEHELSYFNDDDKEYEGLNDLLENADTNPNSVMLYVYTLKMTKSIKFPKKIEIDLDEIIRLTENFLELDVTTSSITTNAFYNYLKLLRMYRNLTYTSNGSKEFDEIS